MSRGRTARPEWLKDGGATSCVTGWRLSDDHLFDVVYLSGVERDEWRAHLAVSRLAAAFLRDQRPHSGACRSTQTGSSGSPRTRQAGVPASSSSITTFS